MKGCQAGMGCQGNGGHRVVKDDIAPLLEEIYEAVSYTLDAIVYRGLSDVEIATLEELLRRVQENPES
jgi:hypothetical protein